MVAQSDCNRMDINWVQVKHAYLESAYRQLWHSGDFSDTSAWFLSGDLTILKANFGSFIFSESKISQFHQSFPYACSALITDVTNRAHREADDVTPGRCSMLQLPEYNNPSLNVIILTLCGISIPAVYNISAKHFTLLWPLTVGEWQDFISVMWSWGFQQSYCTYLLPKSKGE